MAKYLNRWFYSCGYWLLIIVLYVSCRSVVILNTYIDDQGAALPEEYHKVNVHRNIPSDIFLNNSNISGNYSVGREQDIMRQKLAHVVLDAAAGCFSLVRSDNVSYMNGHWQSLREHKVAIFIYSAFYDDRHVVGKVPVIRVLAVSVQAPSTLYCHIWYDHLAMPYIATVNAITSGRGDKFASIKYDQYLYTCALPLTWPVPTHVSITTGSCRNSSHYLPIHVNSRTSQNEKEFGVCVAIAFDKIPENEFIEWMELHRMFGVAEFNVYNGSISTQMNQVFKYYIDMELLRVIPMPPPIQDFSKKGVKLASPASLNDCMMRNWHRYKYILVIDFDEFIVPRIHNNYTTMLSAVDKINKLNTPSHSYTFRNVYYFTTLPVDKSQPKYLKTLRYRTRIEPSKYLYAAKSFIDPRMCMSVFNHYCYRRFVPGNRPQTVDISTDIATSHHYRKCGFNQAKCKALTDKTYLDDVTLKYKSELDRRVQKAFNEINKP